MEKRATSGGRRRHRRTGVADRRRTPDRWEKLATEGGAEKAAMTGTTESHAIAMVGKSRLPDEWAKRMGQSEVILHAPSSSSHQSMFSS